MHSKKVTFHTYTYANTRNKCKNHNPQRRQTYSIHAPNKHAQIPTSTAIQSNQQPVTGSALCHTNVPLYHTASKKFKHTNLKFLTPRKERSALQKHHITQTKTQNNKIKTNTSSISYTVPYLFISPHNPYCSAQCPNLNTSQPKLTCNKLKYATRMPISKFTSKLVCNYPCNNPTHHKTPEGKHTN
eukprot:gene2793-1778_t